MASTSKFRALKFEGDDTLSWAVFYAKDVYGIKGVVFSHQAKPIVSGCSLQEANSTKRRLEKEYVGVSLSPRMKRKSKYE